MFLLVPNSFLIVFTFDNVPEFFGTIFFCTIFYTLCTCPLYLCCVLIY